MCVLLLRLSVYTHTCRVYTHALTTTTATTIVLYIQLFVLYIASEILISSLQQTRGEKTLPCRCCMTDGLLFPHQPFRYMMYTFQTGKTKQLQTRSTTTTKTIFLYIVSPIFYLFVSESWIVICFFWLCFYYTLSYYINNLHFFPLYPIHI